LYSNNAIKQKLGRMKKADPDSYRESDTTGGD
jgi:hypothetical protein